AEFLDALAWTEHAEDFVLRVGAARVGGPRAGPGGEVERRSNAESPDRTKPARQGADDRIRVAREHERAPDDVRVASELPIPEGMRHHDRVRRLPHRLAGEHTALGHRNAEHREIVGTDDLAEEPDGLILRLPHQFVDTITGARDAGRLLTDVVQIQPG